MEGFRMISYNSENYTMLLGNINESMIDSAASCISQCTGCMCSCRCSCSGGVISEFEWEEI
ncbi:FibroRumin family radical SAM-modified Cys-rich RiPP [Veillonella sp.]|uniref:FibroRumin family radical SAM-modified Cys-rich RiPP n=2 Tax=Veillonella sp. TaxID=1926307 RepID=UPI0037DDB875